jgi:hypothetical protein
MTSCCCLSVCVCIPPIVTRQRIGKSPPIVARQRLDRNPPIVARQRLGRIVTAVVLNVARVVSRKVGD